MADVALSYDPELVTIGSHRLAVCRAGPVEGRAAILLHAGLGDASDWRATVPVLADAGLEVVAYDRWGYGLADPRPGFAPPPFDDDVADLMGLLDALGLARAVLVGHSDGGTIALALAAAAPERVTAVVAVAAHVCVELKTRAGIAELVDRYDGDAAFRASLARRHGDKAEATFRAWSSGWLRRDAWRWDMRPYLAEVRCPCLVIQGTDDEYATVDHARDIAEGIGGAELWLVPEVGHMVPQAAPEPFHARVLAFLGRSELRGA